MLAANCTIRLPRSASLLCSLFDVVLLPVDQIFSKPPPAAAKPSVTYNDSRSPRSSSGLTPLLCVIRPPATLISRAEPPGLTLSAMAESFTTTPLTGRDRASIAHVIRESPVNHKDDARDAIRRSRRNSSIAIDRSGLQPADNQPAASVTRAAYENAAAAHRTAVPASGNAGEVGRDRDMLVGLHVPERKGAMENVDAVPVRAIAFRSRIGRDDVESVHIDMPAAHLAARQNLHAPYGRNAVQFDPAQSRAGRIIKNLRASPGRR